MLRTVIIGADNDLSQKLETSFQELGRFAAVRTIERYPETMELEQILLAQAPQTVFLCADTLSAAIAVRNGIEQTVPGVPIVAFGRNTDQPVLLELMKVGVREFLPVPFQSDNVIELADRIEDQLAKNPLQIESTDLMFSFLPAKPGVGTSTLALNFSMALSRQPETKVLLADFDLNSGLLAFMLKLAVPHTIVDAVSRSGELDENLWPQLVSEVGDLHVLPCGRPEPGARIEPDQIHRMLTFARRQYGAICADLSGNMEKYSIELMQESKRIFLVTTPEIPPLHLARQRYDFLRNIDLGDRISILLNRWSKRSAISVPQIEDLLGAPVYETFPNNYDGVHRALVGGKPVDPKSDMGKRFSALARRIINPGAKEPQRAKRKFLETFSILPRKYSLTR